MMRDEGERNLVGSRERERNVTFGWFKRQRAGRCDKHCIRLIKERLWQAKRMWIGQGCECHQKRKKKTETQKITGLLNTKLSQDGSGSSCSLFLLIFPVPFSLEEMSFHLMSVSFSLEALFSISWMKGGWQLEFISFALKSIFICLLLWVRWIEFRSLG